MSSSRPSCAEVRHGAKRARAGPPTRERLQRRLEAWSSTGEDWLWEATPDGRFSFSGPAVRHCGYGPDELVGVPITDVLHPCEHDRLRRLMEAGLGWRDEVWHCLKKDGSSVWLRGNAVVERDSSGAVAFYMGTAHLLSAGEERERARRARAEQLRELIAAERLDVVFQPIVGTDTGALLGAEALSRLQEPSPGPDVVFEQAAAVGVGVELELLAVRKALAAAAHLPGDVYVSVNVSPATLRAPALAQPIAAAAVPACRIVLELTEHESIEDYSCLLAVLGPLRESGVRLAVDDAGAGFASFRHILQLRPDFIKLDRTLISGIEDDAARRALVSAVVLLAMELEAAVVAEGVETIAELRTATLLGIDAAQGFLLGRPTGAWETWSDWHSRGRLYRIP